MLSQILAEFEQTKRGLCLEEIAQRIGKDPSVVAGGLDQLVNMGKLEKIETSKCDSCPVRSMCGVISDSNRIYNLSAGKSSRIRS